MALPEAIASSSTFGRPSTFPAASRTDGTARRCRPSRSSPGAPRARRSRRASTLVSSSTRSVFRPPLELGAEVSFARDHDGELSEFPGWPIWPIQLRRGVEQILEALLPDEPSDSEDHDGLVVDPECSPELPSGSRARLGNGSSVYAVGDDLGSFSRSRGQETSIGEIVATRGRGRRIAGECELRRRAKRLLFSRTRNTSEPCRLTTSGKACALARQATPSPRSGRPSEHATRRSARRPTRREPTCARQTSARGAAR